MNGSAGRAIAVRTDVRQGCPLSPALYVLALDPALALLERQVSLSGIRWPTGGGGGDGEKNETTIKVIAHADDVNVFLTGGSGKWHAVEDVFHSYEAASGATIQLAKSLVVDLDARKDDGLLVCRSWASEVRRWKDEEEEEDGANSRDERVVRVLGILFTTNPNEWRENWLRWEEGAVRRMARWRSAKWSLHLFQRAALV